MPQPVKSPTREQIRGAFEWTARYYSGGAHIGEPDLSDRAAEVLGDRCYTLLAHGARDWQQRNGGPLNRPRRIYLAARYSRHNEMRAVRDVLLALGYEVTSRWIDQHNGTLEQSYTPAKLNADPDECAVLGQHDLDDLKAADTVISFTSVDGGGKGGRHVEHGFALGLGKQVIICGPRENIFHTLPQIRWFPDWRHLAGDLAAMAARGAA